MADAPDYSFYVSQYDGQLGDAAFRKLLPAAVAYVSWLTKPARMRNGEPIDANATAWKRAVCAVVDVYAENGMTDIKSMSVGGFSITNGSSPERLAEIAASCELAGTCPNLLYQGA